jgi:hypothetical protein
LTVTSDKPRRLAFELPNALGNAHSGVSITIGDRVFKCRPVIDGITLLEFGQLAAGAVSDGDAENMDPAQAAAYSTALIDFLRNTIVDYDSFRAFVRDNSVDIDMLGDIAGKLVEEYTARPTQSPPVL